MWGGTEGGRACNLPFCQLNKSVLSTFAKEEEIVVVALLLRNPRVLFPFAAVVEERWAKITPWQKCLHKDPHSRYDRRRLSGAAFFAFSANRVEEEGGKGTTTHWSEKNCANFHVFPLRRPLLHPMQSRRRGEQVMHPRLRRTPFQQCFPTPPPGHARLRGVAATPP